MKPQDYRTIFHIDGDAFYASVEETLHPELKKVPMAICGDPKSRRGVILARNQLANRYGVKTAETVWQAKQKCPNLVLAPSRHDLYQEFCEQLNSIYEEYTDQVERLSIDESFLDVTGSLHLFGNNRVMLAHEIRQRVEDEVGITVSVGVSYNKIFAKMASDLNKPNAVSMITPSTYPNIIWPLPVEKLYMVGKVTAKKLHDLNIHTIGGIAKADPEHLYHALGKLGTQLHYSANGQDDSPVLSVEDREDIQSVGNGRTFKRNLLTLADIKVGVVSLSDTVASRLRKKNIKCTTVQVMIKDPEFKVITRQAPISPTWLAFDISQKALEIIQQSWSIGKPIRMLTITGANLIPASQATEQLSLFAPKGAREQTEKREKLEQTMDSIRDKFGTDSISPGSIMENDLGIRDKYAPEEPIEES